MLAAARPATAQPGASTPQLEPGSASDCCGGLLVVRGAEQAGRRDATWLRRRLAPAFGELVLDAEVWVRQVDAGPEPGALAPLVALEGLLARARTQAANLAESAALASLAEAERLAAQAAPLPGAAAWNAEVQLRLGLVAAQAGLSALAEQALRRALLLDPQRQVGEAEAAPATVALAAKLRREVALSPRGTFAVSSEPSGARVFWDDAELGTTPLQLEAPVGRHLLRIEAPEHASVGTFVEVLEGARAPVHIALPPSARALRARRVLAAARAGEYAAMGPLLAALGRGVRQPLVLIVERGARPRRALLVTCQPRGCRGPRRLLPSAPSARELTKAAPPLAAEPLARARRWLDDTFTAPARVEREPLWSRWYLWSGALAAAAAVTVALVAAQSHQPERRLRLVVDPSGVGQ